MKLRVVISISINFQNTFYEEHLWVAASMLFIINKDCVYSSLGSKLLTFPNITYAWPDVKINYGKDQ